MSMSAAFACALAYMIVRYVDNGVLAWQTMARPIVVAPLTGLLLGDLNTGIIMGGSLEAIFMGISAIGGSVPSDALSGSIIAVAYTISVGGAGAMETGLALAMTVGTIMESLNNAFKPVWAAMAAFWEKLALECNPKKFALINFLFYPVQNMPGFVAIFLSCAYGIEGIDAALAACPAWVIPGLNAAGTMMTAVGFGILLAQIWDPQICIFYFVGFIMAKSLGLSSLGIAVIAACVVITLFFLEKNIVDAKKSIGSTGATSAANSEEDFF